MPATAKAATLARAGTSARPAALCVDVLVSVIVWVSVITAACVALVIVAVLVATTCLGCPRLSSAKAEAASIAIKRKKTEKNFMMKLRDGMLL